MEYPLKHIIYIQLKTLNFYCFFINNLIPKTIINIPTTIFKILIIISGIKFDNNIPKIATIVKNNKVADTNPTEKIINSFFLKFSSIIFVVKTLPQNIIVIGLDSVNIIP